MGKPVRLRSDGGPQFRSEFEDWAKKENITHELSSPCHHQSNGHAEVTEREMKYLLTKTERNWQKFGLALRENRNIPRFDGLSPSKCTMVRGVMSKYFFPIHFFLLGYSSEYF